MHKADGLTPSLLRSLKPPAVGQKEHRDRDGLCLRMSQAGTATWVLGCRDAQGKSRRFPLGSYPALGLAQARLDARELRERVRKGYDPIQEARQAREKAAAPKLEIATLTTLLDSYEKDVGARRRSWGEARRRIESVFVKHLDIDTLTITEPALQLTVDAHPSRSSAGAAVRYIRPVLKWGAKRGLVARGTGRELSQPEGALGKRSRQLSREEIKAILGVLGDAGAYGQVVRWLFWTACRLNEACGMRWRDVDLTAGIWTVPETKQGTPHVVPLPGLALALLRSLLAKDDKGKTIDPNADALVFPSAGGGVLANWDRATKAMQKASATSNWHRHDIRRSVASLMGDMGVAPHVIEVCLGHALRNSSDGSTLSRVAAVYNRSRYRREHADTLVSLAAELVRIESGRGECSKVACVKSDCVRDKQQRDVNLPPEPLPTGMHGTQASIFKPDEQLLRKRLACMDWVMRLPASGRQAMVDSLTHYLLPAIGSAIAGLPPLPPKTRKVAARKRAEGSGRPPDETRSVLASDIERAFETLGLPTGRWRVEGENSAMLDALTVCWEVATVKDGKAGEVLRDGRRMFKQDRQWVIQPQGDIGPTIT